MISIGGISQGLTMKVKKGLPDIDEQKAEVIEYGLYMIISEIIKISAVFIISYFLGIFKYMLLVALLSTIHRGSLGGIHAKTHLGCFLTSCFIFVGTIYFSLCLNLDTRILCFFTYPICMLIAYKYAPADNLNKPIVSNKQRSFLRKFGFTYITLAFIVALLVTQPYSKLIIITEFVQSLTMHPVAYRLSKNEYGKEVM